MVFQKHDLNKNFSVSSTLAPKRQQTKIQEFENITNDAHTQKSIYINSKHICRIFTSFFVMFCQQNGYILTNRYEFVIESLNDDYHKTGLHMLTACKVIGMYNTELVYT